MPMRILVIGLSNVGDAVLMSPVIGAVRAAYPQAELALVVGERARAVFARDPRITTLLSLDEAGKGRNRLKLLWWMWGYAPDLFIDVRQTLLPLVWKPWRAWRYARPVPKAITHMRDRHLWRLRAQVGRELPLPEGPPIWIAPEDDAAADRLLQHRGIQGARRVVILCPGARSHTKRWYGDRFAAVADRLIQELGVDILLTGEPDEAPIIDEVAGAMRRQAHSAVGSTTVPQLAALMRRAALVVTNDSASLHVASAVGTPTLALFGPTDPRKYGPTAPRSRAIHRRLFCAPCEQALCRFHHECMRFISIEDVVNAAKELLQPTADSRQHTAHSKQQTEEAPS
ncbi:MAG: glycosyltransferase family 9 protein [Candidatus Omnitrophica bacterium]|nr:glycosyltransferase family 9 protein [Candidatus Omnitrophota bacterium]